jgi:hypothetical protein
MQMMTIPAALMLFGALLMISWSVGTVETAIRVLIRELPVAPRIEEELRGIRKALEEMAGEGWRKKGG